MQALMQMPCEKGTSEVCTWPVKTAMSQWSNYWLIIRQKSIGEIWMDKLPCTWLVLRISRKVLSVWLTGSNLWFFPLSVLNFLIFQFRGTDVRIRDKQGRTALLTAVISGSIGCVKCITKKALWSIEDTDKYDRTALFLAARYNQLDVVKVRAE